MEFQSYNEELAIANILFKNIFSNIRIGRTDLNGNQTQLLVQCMLGNRSRILKNIENPERKGNYKLPMIVIERTGYSRNGDRLNNMHNEVKYELASYMRKYEWMTPVPIDISYDVSIIAKYPQDIDKIASNFMIFFNSDIYVSCEHPKYQGVKMNNQVIMQDSISEDHPDEFDGSQDDIMTSTFQFTFKTFLFGGTKKAKLIHAPVISTYLSDVVTAQVVVLGPDQIDDFQKKYPDKSVSAELTTIVTSTLTSVIDDGPEIYDNIPPISRIDFGFYVVPGQHDIQSYIQSVDNEVFCPHEHMSVLGYLSSEKYLSNDATINYDPYAISGMSPEDLSACRYDTMDKPLSTIDDYYDYVDLCCSFEPYVDRLYWTIDGASADITWHRD